MPAAERDRALPRVVSGVSMHDLLAACAAAKVISTPPPEPDPETSQPSAEHRKAA